ncbi:MAG: hypothetical protein ACE5MB_10620 [Anaerolineae bacterium]
MRLAIATLGFTSIIGQVVLMRELVAVFYGNELVFGLILAAWLIWGAVGSWGLGRLADRYELGAGAFTAGLALAALLLPFEIALTRAIRTLLGITPGAFASFGAMVWAILLILGPLCVLLGFQFTLGSRLLAQWGGTIGRAYVYEGWGAALGGALFSFLIVRFLNPFQIALGVGAVNLAVAGGISGELRVVSGGRFPRLPLVLLSSLLLLSLALPLGGWLHQATLSWQWRDLLFAQDSIYGRLVVTGRDSQRVFFENGLIMFETQSTFPEEVVHFPLLEHPDPGSVLLIGGGAGGDLREILKHPVAEVHYVELDPLVIQAAEAYLAPRDRAVFDDPRVTLAYLDGRLYVKRSPRRFDVIIVDLPEPYTGQLNRFYTREFFEEVRAILNEGGILSLGLPSAENYWSPELARRNGSVFHTLRSVFPSILALPGDHNFFLASAAPLTNDPRVLIQRLRQRGIETRWVNEPYIEYIFTTDRFELVRRNLEEALSKLNRDLVPICYYYNMVLWLSLFYSGLREGFYATSLFSLWWLVVPLVLLVAFLRWRRFYAIPALIGFTGFAEMTIEVVVLLAFQALHGYVYHEVSLIVAAFMVGLAAGGAAMNALLGRMGGGLRALRVLMLVQGVMVLYALSLPMALTRIAAWAYPFLTLLAGFLGGFDFPLAAELTRLGGLPRLLAARPQPLAVTSQQEPIEGISRVAGLIYGMDLVGACLGALLGSALFIPVLGIPQTCYAVAILSLAGLALLV